MSSTTFARRRVATRVTRSSSGSNNSAITTTNKMQSKTPSSPTSTLSPASSSIASSPSLTSPPLSNHSSTSKSHLSAADENRKKTKTTSKEKALTSDTITTGTATSSSSVLPCTAHGNDLGSLLPHDHSNDQQNEDIPVPLEYQSTQTTAIGNDSIDSNIGFSDFKVPSDISGTSNEDDDDGNDNNALYLPPSAINNSLAYPSSSSSSSYIPPPSTPTTTRQQQQQQHAPPQSLSASLASSKRKASSELHNICDNNNNNNNLRRSVRHRGENTISPFRFDSTEEQRDSTLFTSSNMPQTPSRLKQMMPHGGAGNNNNIVGLGQAQNGANYYTGHRKDSLFMSLPASFHDAANGSIYAPPPLFDPSLLPKNNGNTGGKAGGAFNGGSLFLPTGITTSKMGRIISSSSDPNLSTLSFDNPMAMAADMDDFSQYLSFAGNDGDGGGDATGSILPFDFTSMPQQAFLQFPPTPNNLNGAYAFPTSVVTTAGTPAVASVLTAAPLINIQISATAPCTTSSMNAKSSSTFPASCQTQILSQSDDLSHYDSSMNVVTANGPPKTPSCFSVDPAQMKKIVRPLPRRARQPSECSSTAGSIIIKDSEDEEEEDGDDHDEDVDEVIMQEEEEEGGENDDDGSESEDQEDDEHRPDNDEDDERFALFASQVRRKAEALSLKNSLGPSAKSNPRVNANANDFMRNFESSPTKALSRSTLNSRRGGAGFTTSSSPSSTLSTTATPLNKNAAKSVTRNRSDANNAISDRSQPNNEAQRHQGQKAQEEKNSYSLADGVSSAKFQSNGVQLTNIGRGVVVRNALDQNDNVFEQSQIEIEATTLEGQQSTYEADEDFAMAVSTEKLSKSKRGHHNKKRDKPPRPPNCFMMYRSDKVKEINENRHQKDHMQKDLSKYVADLWKQEPQDVKDRYVELANKAREEHLILYPGYVYQPTRKNRSSTEMPDDKPSPLKRSESEYPPMTPQTLSKPVPASIFSQASNAMSPSEIFSDMYDAPMSPAALKMSSARTPIRQSFIPLPSGTHQNKYVTPRKAYDSPVRGFSNIPVSTSRPIKTSKQSAVIAENAEFFAAQRGILQQSTNAIGMQYAQQASRSSPVKSENVASGQVPMQNATVPSTPLNKTLARPTSRLQKSMSTQHVPRYAQPTASSMIRGSSQPTMSQNGDQNVLMRSSAVHPQQQYSSFAHLQHPMPVSPTQLQNAQNNMMAQVNGTSTGPDQQFGQTTIYDQSTPASYATPTDNTALYNDIQQSASRPSHQRSTTSQPVIQQSQRIPSLQRANTTPAPSASMGQDSSTGALPDGFVVNGRLYPYAKAAETMATAFGSAPVSKAATPRVVSNHSTASNGPVQEASYCQNMLQSNMQPTFQYSSAYNPTPVIFVGADGQQYMLVDHVQQPTPVTAFPQFQPVPAFMPSTATAPTPSTGCGQGFNQLAEPLPMFDFNSLLTPNTAVSNLTNLPTSANYWFPQATNVFPSDQNMDMSQFLTDFTTNYTQTGSGQPVIQTDDNGAQSSLQGSQTVNTNPIPDLNITDFLNSLNAETTVQWSAL